MRTAYKVATAVMAIFWAGAAVAAEPTPLNLSQRYDVAWGGIPIGRIRFHATEADGHYKVTVDTKTSGVARLFSSEKTLAEVAGDGGIASTYIPRRYYSAPQREDGKGVFTELTYDSAGKLSLRKREPDDNPAWRPAVPAEQANTATDPITAGLRLRQILLKQPSPTEAITLRTYEGARLAEMKFTPVQVDEALEIMDKPTPVLKLKITRTPILGYTPKEQKKFAEGDPNIYLYFSKEGLLPVKAAIDAPFGQLTATAVNDD